MRGRWLCALLVRFCATGFRQFDALDLTDSRGASRGY